MNSPRRRTLLGVLGTTAVGASAGCLGTGTSTETSPRPTETDTSATTGPGTTEGTDPGTTDSAGTEPTDETDSTTTTRNERTDDLFLANRVSDDRLLDLRVTRRPGSATGGEGGGERLLSRHYEVPAGSWLELPNLVVAENTYTVEARLPGGQWREFAWAVTDCSEYGTPTQEPRTPEDDPTLNTDAVVEIRDGGLEFLRNACDGIAFSRDRAPPASEYVVRDYLATTTTTA